MALEGSIKDFGLADIFQLIHLQKKTGVLSVKNPAHNAKVQFEQGLVVTAGTTDADSLDKIGEVLLKAGRIKAEQLREAIQTHDQTKEKIGAILVQIGAVTKEDLSKALRLQLNEIVYSLFKWKEGQYSFAPSAITYDHEYSKPVNTEFLLMEGVRRVDEWPFIEKKIPDLGMVFGKNQQNSGKIKGVRSEEDSIDAAFGDAPAEEGIRLTEDEMKVYSIIDGRMDVRYLSEVAELGEFETCKALSNLLTVELIVVLEGLDRPQAETGETKRARPRAPILTRRIFGSLLVIAAVAMVVVLKPESGAGYLYVLSSLNSHFQEIKTGNTIRLTESYIRTFYHQRNTLPESLVFLGDKGYLPPPLMEQVLLGELRYTPLPPGDAFLLSKPGK